MLSNEHREPECGAESQGKGCSRPRGRRWSGKKVFKESLTVDLSNVPHSYPPHFFLFSWQELIIRVPLRMQLSMRVPFVVWVFVLPPGPSAI